MPRRPFCIKGLAGLSLLLPLMREAAGHPLEPDVDPKVQVGMNGPEADPWEPPKSIWEKPAGAQDPAAGIPPGAGAEPKGKQPAPSGDPDHDEDTRKAIELRRSCRTLPDPEQQQACVAAIVGEHGKWHKEHDPDFGADLTDFKKLKAERKKCAKLKSSVKRMQCFRRVNALERGKKQRQAHAQQQ